MSETPETSGIAIEKKPSESEVFDLMGGSGRWEVKVHEHGLVALLDVMPRFAPYSRWQAHLLQLLRVTKSLRSEYDHLMLQLHDAMKKDMDYQQDAHQVTMPFAPGSVWVCFSDQTSHAVMSGQYMMEQTFHLPAAKQYDPEASPLAILTRLTGRKLI